MFEIGFNELLLCVVLFIFLGFEKTFFIFVLVKRQLNKAIKYFRVATNESLLNEIQEKVMKLDSLDENTEVGKELKEIKKIFEERTKSVHRPYK